MGVTPLETKFLMKLNGRDDTDIHAQREKAISDRYNQSVMNMFPTYNAGEQLMRNLSEGGDVQANREGEASVLENMQIMMMMGYGDGAREDGIGYKVTCKGSTSSASVNVGPSTAPARTSGRRRGVRGSAKNSEERETQRMTHIAVERNRRRQMNEHLRVLRALMPPSYVQRGDQASIIGGAIEFVRELEQLLQCLESQKRRRLMASPIHSTPSMQPGGGMNEYTSENQLVSLQHQQEECALAQVDGQRSLQREDQPHEEVAHAKSIVADIEVKMIDRCQAFIKILSQHRPRQLLHTIAALQDHLCFSILHTNVTTIEKTVLYSFTVKINNAQEYSANKIASTVQEVFIEIIRHVPLKRL
ncbi:hypothetical protein KP509_24G025300 [Ceratopteris richardii]|uniref:BHLH domain-containing protein n=1 Tax=Ceratopteris richardii TaxID=49495 RepID=A0A8T2RVX8_CERRI|nr:hypothetical protein KP509_24G025300 [Ceratopteris richardii]